MRLGMDKSEIEALEGFFHTIEVGTRSNRYIGPALKYVHSVMSDKFNRHVDGLAFAAGPDKGSKNPYHHVYEWGLVSAPQGRLWDNRLEGGGSTRMATFNWRASKKTVPVPDDELGPNAGDKKFKRIHVFVWKAMVMEFQDAVTISPKRGQWLGWESDSEFSVDGLEFSRGPITIDPGGGNTVGTFTSTFAEWWGGPGAEVTFDKEIRKIMEGKMAASIQKNFPRGTRVRPKNVGLQSIVKGAGFARGQAAAERFLAENRRDWIAAANRRDRFGVDSE